MANKQPLFFLFFLLGALPLLHAGGQKQAAGAKKEKCEGKECGKEWDKDFLNTRENEEKNEKKQERSFIRIPKDTGPLKACLSCKPPVVCACGEKWGRSLLRDNAFTFSEENLRMCPGCASQHKDVRKIVKEAFLALVDAVGKGRNLSTEENSNAFDTLIAEVETVLETLQTEIVRFDAELVFERKEAKAKLAEHLRKQKPSQKRRQTLLFRDTHLDDDQLKKLGYHESYESKSSLPEIRNSSPPKELADVNEGLWDRRRGHSPRHYRKVLQAILDAKGTGKRKLAAAYRRLPEYEKRLTDLKRTYSIISRTKLEELTLKSLAGDLREKDFVDLNRELKKIRDDLKGAEEGTASVREFKEGILEVWGLRTPRTLASLIAIRDSQIACDDKLREVQKIFEKTESSKPLLERFSRVVRISHSPRPTNRQLSWQADHLRQEMSSHGFSAEEFAAVVEIIDRKNAPAVTGPIVSVSEESGVFVMHVSTEKNLPQLQSRLSMRVRVDQGTRFSPPLYGIQSLAGRAGHKTVVRLQSARPTDGYYRAFKVGLPNNVADFGLSQQPPRFPFFTPFTATDSKNEEVSLQDYQDFPGEPGRPVLLYFWKSTSTVAMKQFQTEILPLVRKIEKRGVSFLSCAFEESGDRAGFDRSLSQLSPPGKHIFQERGTQSPIALDCKIERVPTTVLLNSEGQAIYRVNGKLGLDDAWYLNKWSTVIVSETRASNFYPHLLRVKTEQEYEQISLKNLYDLRKGIEKTQRSREQRTQEKLLQKALTKQWGSARTHLQKVPLKKIRTTWQRLQWKGNNRTPYEKDLFSVLGRLVREKQAIENRRNRAEAKRQKRKRRGKSSHEERIARLREAANPTMPNVVMDLRGDGVGGRVDWIEETTDVETVRRHEYVLRFENLLQALCDADYWYPEAKERLGDAAPNSIEAQALYADFRLFMMKRLTFRHLGKYLFLTDLPVPEKLLAKQMIQNLESSAKAARAEGKTSASYGNCDKVLIPFSCKGGEKQLSLRDFRGKIVLVYFWSAHPSPFMGDTSISLAVDLYEHLKDKGLVVVAVAIQASNIPDKHPAAVDFGGPTKRLLKKAGAEFPCAVVNSSLFVPARYLGLDNYPRRTIPAAYLLDRNGVVQAYSKGPLNKFGVPGGPKFKNALDELLGVQPSTEDDPLEELLRD